jgi:hypothetical protein
MARYRKKPVVIEARQLTAGGAKELARWINGEGGDASFGVRSATVIISTLEGEDASFGAWSDVVIISTLEGDMHATPGDYIIQEVVGEFYPCKPDIFAATYEAVEP